MAQNSGQQEFNLREYWQILVRRRWLIYTCILVTTVAAIVQSFMATPLYRSTVTLQIERTGVRVLSQTLSSAEPSWLDYQNWYNTQYQVMASDAVVRTAVKEMGLQHRDILDSDEESQLGFLKALSKLKNSVMARFASASEGEAPAGEPDPLAPYIGLVREGMSVEPVRDSQLVQISYVHKRRAFAQEVANALGDAYIDFMQRGKLEIALRSKKFFMEQAANLRERIREEEQGLRTYAARNNITTGDSNDTALKDLQDVRNSLIAARSELARSRARLDSLIRSQPEAIAEVRENSVIQQQRNEVARLENEYSRLSATRGENLPTVREKKQQLDSARQRLEEETARVARQIINQARSAVLQYEGEVDGLEALFNETDTRVGTLQQALVEFESRQATVDQMRTTLNDILSRMNQMELSANFNDRAQNIRVIEPANLPQGVFKPNKKLNIALGFLFGLFLGVGAAFLMEYIDNTIKTPDDVRNVLDAAVLGMIPAQEESSREKAPRKRRGQRSGAAFGGDPGLVSARTPLSPVAEAYRELRTAVLLATPGHPPRDLAVTSCQPGEGKTTTAINLATTLAQLGRNVLLVDTDLRRPRCHQVLKASASRGVSTFLTGMNDIDALVQPTAIERVSLIPAGPIPPNPAELLDADRFVELVRKLRGREDFDHVIFDSPPVLSVVDPLLIGRHTEGTILVIRSAYTTRDAGRLGLEKLRTGRIQHLLGVVLNAVQLEHVPYQYRYYRTGYKQDQASGSRERTKKRTAVASGGRSDS